MPDENLIALRVAEVRVAVPAGNGVEAGLVVLEEEGEPYRQLRMYVGQPEARAIHVAWSSTVPPRPSTWDLFVTTLSILDTRIIRTVLTDVEEGRHYFAHVELERAGHDEPVVLTARPSDALALALRAYRADIVARSSVLDEAGLLADGTRWVPPPAPGVGDPSSADPSTSDSSRVDPSWADPDADAVIRVNPEPEGPLGPVAGSDPPVPPEGPAPAAPRGEDTATAETSPARRAVPAAYLGDGGATADPGAGVPGDARATPDPVVGAPLVAASWADGPGADFPVAGSPTPGVAGDRGGKKAKKSDKGGKSKGKGNGSKGRGSKTAGSKERGSKGGRSKGDGSEAGGSRTAGS